MSEELPPWYRVFDIPMLLAPLGKAISGNGSKLHGAGADPASKSQARQPPQAGAPLVQLQVPELQLWPAGQALVQLPQWLLSLPFTLMQPLAPQSVPVVHWHTPDEQVLPVPQLVPSFFVDHPDVLVVGWQAWHGFEELAAPLE